MSFQANLQSHSLTDILHCLTLTILCIFKENIKQHASPICIQVKTLDPIQLIHFTSLKLIKLESVDCIQKGEVTKILVLPQGVIETSAAVLKHEKDTIFLIYHVSRETLEIKFYFECESYFDPVHLTWINVLKPLCSLRYMIAQIKN